MKRLLTGLLAGCLLALPAGRTVMVLDAINGDPQRRPIQYSRARFCADRVQLVVKN